MRLVVRTLSALLVLSARAAAQDGQLAARLDKPTLIAGLMPA